jgi:hypothetical protein
MGTQTAMVSVFGATLEPTSQATPGPTTSAISRAAPTQTSILDWLQSIVVPSANTVESVTEVVSSVSLSVSQTSDSGADNSTSSTLWGAAAAAMIGTATAYALEEKRKRQEEEARRAAQVRAEVDAKNDAIQASQEAKREALKVQNWLQGQALLNAQVEEAKKQGATMEQVSALKKIGATQGLRAAIDRAADLTKSLYTATLNTLAHANIRTARKEALVEEELKALSAKPQEWEDGYNAYMAQKATQDWRAGEKETYVVKPKEKSWWDDTKSFMSEKIIQPLNTYVYQPYIKPAAEQTKETVINGISWANENIYQPYVKPVTDKSKEMITNGLAWTNENIYKPYIKPLVEKAIEEVTNGISWINKNVYEPYVQPVVEKTKQKITDGISWVNKNFYQPFIQPLLTTINEKIYQPYVEPLLEKTKEAVTNGASWINKNIYQPYFEPVVSDIKKYIYQPYFNPIVDKVSGIWDKYGEWVHGALDAAGVIPGLGEIADGINSLIYLGEGRYIEASVSAMAMIPLLGDLGKAGKWTLKAGQEIVETVVEKATKELAEEAIQKIAKESAEELIERAAKEATSTVIQDTVIEQTVEEILEKVGDETAQRVLKDVVEGKVTKLPADVVENLTEESASELAGKISKELGDKKVWVSAETGSMYVSSPPAEGFLLAEQLSKTDLTKTEEVEKILKRIAELTSRGSGDHVILGPFRPNGTFIQKALDTNGVFWDVGDELWEALDKTGIDMFKANDQFLRVQIERNIDRLDVVGENVDNVIEKFSSGPTENWGKISYTRKEILDLASMPDIPYKQVGNSWVRIDLIEP